jgi:D-alanyl-D-alanine carboxypeptidase
MSRVTSRATLSVAVLCLLFSAVPTYAASQEAVWGGELVERIDSLASATLRDGPVAGLTIGVKRGGDLLMVKGYGVADIENTVPMTAGTVYRIGSLTKQFTAAAIMQLVEAGKIGLDDPIQRYLPDYSTQGHEVSIRHLLTHTSGIKSYTSLGDVFWLEAGLLDLSHAQMRALFEEEPFDFAPGEEYRYNNSGYYLLGVIIEVVSGEVYGDYLETHLFRPLGLTRSLYCHESQIIPGRAEGYEQGDGELLNDGSISMNTPGAAGAMCSTVPDLLSWTRALRSGRVVSEASYQAMTTSGQLNDSSAIGYGFALGVGTLEGHSRVAHTGGINGFSTVMAHYPDSDLDIVVLSNTSSAAPGQIESRIARWALGIAIEP